MPKVIVNTCYIKSSAHFLNYLEYAGEKIEAQSVTFTSGETLSIAPDALIDMEKDITKINVTFKDGKAVSMTPQRYRLFTDARQTEYVSPDLLDASGAVQKENMDTIKYLDYIAHRPSVEKIDGAGHGLFDMTGTVDIGNAKKLAEQYEKRIKWSHIVSLTRADAARTGYDNRAAWETLIHAKATELAKIYNISLENLVLNCAFHNKDDHPHIHLFLYSKDSREGFVTGGTAALTKCSEKMKSLFFNEIFRDDVAYLKETKNDQENLLEKKLKEITRQITNRSYIPPEGLLDRLQGLATGLEKLEGKRYYGYLPVELKEQVNDILQYAVEQDVYLNQAYQEYVKTYRTLVEQYTDDPAKVEERLAGISARLFHPKEKTDPKTLQNVIIKSALQYNEVMQKRKEASPKPKVKKAACPKEEIHTFTAGSKKYQGGDNFKLLDSKDNVLLAEFKKQLNKSLRGIYTDKDKTFSFEWQKKLSDIANQLEPFEFQTFDKLFAHSRKDVIMLIRQLLERDDALKQSYDKLLKGHLELFQKQDNPDELLEKFQAYLFSDSPLNASSLTETVLLFSHNEDAKYTEWRKLNRYNKDIVKQLNISLHSCYTEDGECSLAIQKKIYDLKQLLEEKEPNPVQVETAQADLLWFLAEKDPYFALEYDCLMREQAEVLDAHCFDVAQYKEKHMAELHKLFFKPGAFGYGQLHNAISWFAENSDSHKFNERMKQCDSYKQFNSALFKALNHVYGYEILDADKQNYFEEVQQRLEDVKAALDEIRLEKEAEQVKENTKKFAADPLHPQEPPVPPQLLYSDMEKATKQQIRGLLTLLMEYNPELRGLYSQVKEEYNKAISRKVYYGEPSVAQLMAEFEQRFFEPAVYDTKTSHNIIMKYAEDLEKNQIVSEYNAIRKSLHLQRQRKFKQQQLLQFAVKSMLYGLCQAFSASSSDINLHIGHSKRNIALCKNRSRFSHKRPQEKEQNISAPIQQ